SNAATTARGALSRTSTRSSYSSSSAVTASPVPGGAGDSADARATSSEGGDPEGGDSEGGESEGGDSEGGDVTPSRRARATTACSSRTVRRRATDSQAGRVSAVAARARRSARR